MPTDRLLPVVSVPPGDTPDMSWRAGAALTLLCAVSPARAQILPVVPPIPREEQFVERGKLTASLRIGSSLLQVDDAPLFTLVLTNVGNTSALINLRGLSDPSNLRISTASGQPTRQMTFTPETGLGVGRLDDVIRLRPNQSHEEKIILCHARLRVGFHRVGTSTRAGTRRGSRTSTTPTTVPPTTDAAGAALRSGKG